METLDKHVGESSKEVMARTVCNPKTRVLQKVTVKDIFEMEESFDIWMDKKVEERKNYIQNNLHKYLIEPPIEDIVPNKDICDIIVNNMMDYSADTIFDRAISSIESGLKPSQQRSLWAMYKKKVTKLTKSLNITGAVTSYHPHGSVYGTIVNMTQEDRHQNLLIEGEGNFGQYTSSELMPASDRYTNIRLSKLALDSLEEVDKHYVEMIPTYDNKNTMPLYMPSKYPLILTQASEGMAVGMAGKMPSFNLNEVCDATINYIKTKEKTLLIPDFATYGKIINNKDVIKKINHVGRGTLRLRGTCIINEKDNTIIIKEVPYGVSREDIINKVIELIKEGKLKEVASIKDSTGLKGIGITIKYKKNTNPQNLEEKLCLLTPLESTYPCNMNVLTKGMPKVLGVWDIIPKWISFRESCIIRSLTYEKEGYRKKLHLLEAFEKISKNLEVVSNIMMNFDNPSEKLKEKFNLDNTQAKYIESLQFKDIKKTSVQQKLEEIEQLDKKVSQIDQTINSKEDLMNIIVKDLQHINKSFKSPRRTTIIDEPIKDTKREDIVVEDYNVHYVLSKDGYFKKIKSTSLRGNSEQKLKESDYIVSEREGSNKQDILVFTSLQNCYKIKANDIPDHKASSYGIFIPSYLQLEEGEEIIDAIPTSNYSEDILVAFNTGRVVRLNLSSYITKTNRTKLVKSLYTDKVVRIYILNEEGNYVLKSTNNRAIIFNSKNIPLKATKASRGVIVMKHKDIEVIEFKHISEVEIATIGRYSKGMAGVKILSTDKI